jgi:hypothetical protein
MRVNPPALAVACLAVALSALGQQAPEPKPDFSGTWQLDLERSSLQIRSPDASTFVIDHDDPHWHLERTHVWGDRSDTLTLELTTDGELRAETIEGWEVRSRMHWEEETLVFNTKMSRGEQRTRVVVRYRLEDEGATFIAEEHLDRGQESHDNYWVFSRAAP